MPRIALPETLRGRAFTTAQAAGAGLSSGRLRGPDLAAPFFGTRVPAAAADSLLARCRAYALRMSDDHFFCGITAARLHGAPLPDRLERDARLHVAVPWPTRARVAKQIAGHSVIVQSPDDVWSIHGVRVSRPERMWCELAADLSIADLVAVGDHLIHHRAPVTSARQLAEYADGFPGRRGAAARRAALPLLHPRAESRPESIVRVTLVRAGIIGFEPNVELRTPAGRFRGDLVHRERRIILEYQGDHHRDRPMFRADLTRIAELERVGWRVILLGPADLADPALLIERVRAALAMP